MAQKALLPFYKSKPKPGGSGKIQHTRIYPEECELLDNDLYSPDLNIVSSGLVSRKERFAMLRSAQQYDIILVDEAHYARRQNPRDGSNTAPKYGQLYRALQNGLRPKAKSLWMATATPMQIDPIEVYDLFRLTNRVGPYQHDPTLSMHYFELMSKLVKNESLTRLEWAMLGQSYHQIEALDPFCGIASMLPLLQVKTEKCWKICLGRNLKRPTYATFFSPCLLRLLFLAL